MTIRPPKAPSRKNPDFDHSWHAGDAIPAPEVVHCEGESAWALWDEAARQHEAGFAPTESAPMPAAPAPLSSQEQAWARTQPATSPAPLPRAQRDAQPLFTLETAMLVARRNNRVCPRPQRWAEFARLLPPRKALRGVQHPPAPLTGAAWEVTPSLTKRLCFREQIEWAERAGLLETVMSFMQGLPEEDWLHMGED